MKEVLIDIKDLKDSKEIYLSKPNPYLIGFVYFLIGILLTGIIYSSIAKIDIYSKANGIIRPNDDVSTVTSLLSGKVTQVNIIDGQFVSEGDVLLKIDSSDMELSLRDLNSSKDDSIHKKEMYEKYLDGINSGNNPFKSDIEGDEYFYYVNYLDYSLTLKNNEQQYIYDKNINEANIQNLNSRMATINNELSGLSAYKKSVEQGQNLCAGYPQYENMYLLYEAEINSINAEYASGRADLSSNAENEGNRVYLNYYNEQIEGYDKLIESINTGTSRFSADDETTYALMYKEYVLTKADYEKKYQNNPTELDAVLTSYKNSMLSQYMAARDEIVAKRDSLEAQLNNSADMDKILNSYDADYGNTINAKRYQTLTQIEASIDSLNKERESDINSLKTCKILQEKYNDSVDENGEPLILSIQTVEKTVEVLNNIELYKEQCDDYSFQIDQLEKQIKDCSIVAEQSGTVNMITTIVVGDLISSGITVATIIPPSESEYKVQMYVNNSDIANIDENAVIKYNIAALPYNQYGIVEGTVTKISSDTLVQNGEYSGYYLVEGSISNKKLDDKDGNIGEIGIGMQVEAKIVTQRKTIMRYILEKIDLF